MKTNLGKVSICPKGKYDATTTYNALDVVTYNGNSFMARTENVGVEPVDGDNWQALSELTKDGIIDALGYEPTKAEGDWVLLETITTTEKTTVERTQKPDGTAYKLRAIYVIATTLTQSFQGGAFDIKTAQYNNYRRCSYYWGTTSSTSLYMQSHKFVPDHNRYEIYTSAPDSSGAYAQMMRGWGITRYNNYPFESLSSAYPITGFRSENLPASTIYVYGIHWKEA